MSFRVLAFAAALLISAPAFAEDPRLISTSGDWSAYAFKEGAGNVCYMASQPKKSEGKYTKRDPVFALVTHRPAENTRNVFSYISGYTYAPNAEVELSIDDKKFTLFTHKDMAWAKDAETDNKIAEAIKKGSKMVVKGKSARGTDTVDNFSLKGTGAAHDAIGKACAQ